MDAPTEPRRNRQPWWIPPFLGRVPTEITPDQLRLLGVVALALFFENYDLSMLGSALKFIREDFGLAQSEGGRLQALVRLGALPVLFVIPFVDRLGRRRVFLAALVGMSVGTFATAFAQNAAQFVAAQMLSRTFLLTASATAFVIVTEELPAARRGWGVGMLGALGSCGFGLGALLFAAIEHLPFGWRFLYGVGIAPLLFLPWFRREVHETGRFAREHGAAELDRADRGPASAAPVARRRDRRDRLAHRRRARGGHAAHGRLPADRPGLLPGRLHPAPDPGRHARHHRQPRHGPSRGPLRPPRCGLRRVGALPALHALLLPRRRLGDPGRLDPRGLRGGRGQRRGARARDRALPDRLPRHGGRLFDAGRDARGGHRARRRDPPDPHGRERGACGEPARLDDARRRPRGVVPAGDGQARARADQRGAPLNLGRCARGLARKAS